MALAERGMNQNTYYVGDVISVKYKNLINLQHHVRTIKSHLQNRTNQFCWANMTERSHCTYNALGVTPLYV